MSLLSKFYQLLPVILQQFISSLFLSQRRCCFNIFLSLTLLQVSCLLPLRLFPSNLSVTEPLFLLLSTCLAITRPSWFLNPGSSYTDFSRTAYQKSAIINGLHQVIFYGCQMLWPFKKCTLCPSCFLLEKRNLMAPLSRTRKRDCLQHQCAVVVSRTLPSLSSQLKRRWYWLEEAR